MLSRPPAVLMRPPALPPECDIFCTVIDNFGDVGVCWRLARQLRSEYGYVVRLWIDDLAAFGKICPASSVQLAKQDCEGVVVCDWRSDFELRKPGDIVVEAFACHLPDSFVEAMARRQKPPIWINLDYLSAESWVAEYHALPSPHPRLPLTKYFFFPGFNERTGGLLRERNLLDSRDNFRASPKQQATFWQSTGAPPPSSDCLIVSVFAYENPALNELLEVWARGDSPVCCLAPVTKTLPVIEAFAGRRLRAGDVVQRGKLEIRMLPFVSQTDYDRLLWSSDINFVRGEDSFVRAQWAGQPIIWHIYPQEEDVHLVKLGAFLDLYTQDLPKVEAQIVRRLFLAWNDHPIAKTSNASIAEAWGNYVRRLPAFRAQAENWSSQLSRQEDLCSQLVRFCLNKL